MYMGGKGVEILDKLSQVRFSRKTPTMKFLCLRRVPIVNRADFTPAPYRRQQQTRSLFMYICIYILILSVTHKTLLTIVFYLATSFGPECGSSSGHYTKKERKYTETLWISAIQALIRRYKNLNNKFFNRKSIFFQSRMPVH
jgi:hypothetical protein